MTSIFISHKDPGNYTLAFKLCHNRVMTIPQNLFKQLNLTQIEFLLTNGILQTL